MALALRRGPASWTAAGRRTNGAPGAFRAPTVRRATLMAASKRGGPADNPERAASMPEETDFDRETARLALRMLTARAAAAVLTNVAQVDDFKAAWLKEFIQQNPPIEGNAFLQALMEARPVYCMDPYSGARHYVNPAAIANAVLVTREALAERLAKGLTPKVADANMSLLRQHLEAHTYVSGSNNVQRASFRAYRRGAGSRQQQHH